MDREDFLVIMETSQRNSDEDRATLRAILDKLSGLLDALYEYAEDDEEKDYICETETELYNFCKDKHYI
jgi:hypothetical protein